MSKEQLATRVRHPGWDRYRLGTDPALDRIVMRRFGRNHQKPCRNPTTLTCAAWACQVADRCRMKERSDGAR